jgi:steroid delta-isomerase-like uncharacterized protein
MRTLALLLPSAAFVAAFFLLVLLAACETADGPAAGGVEDAADDRVARNTAAMQQIFDAFNTGDVSAIDSVLAPDAVDHSVLPGTEGTAAEQLKQYIAMARVGFPDLRITVDEQLAAADHVVSMTTFRGTHTGAFMGIAPTGRAVEVEAIDVVRFADGRAIEHWGLGNDLRMMQQLGVVPMPEAPAGSTDTTRAGA